MAQNSFLYCSARDIDKKINGTNPPTKTPDTNVKNAASQTGKQTSFIVLLKAKKTPFLAFKYWFNTAKLGKIRRVIKC